MSAIEELQKVIAASDIYQARLQAVKSEEEAVSALLEIAGAEGIAVERADLEREIEAAKEKASELSDGELEAVSGGGWFGAIAISVIGYGVGCGAVSIISAAAKSNCGNDLKHTLGDL